MIGDETNASFLRYRSSVRYVGKLWTKSNWQDHGMGVIVGVRDGMFSIIGRETPALD